VSDYRRLAAALASRAARLGSRDPESAAQEALRRSLENRKSQPAVAYYFGEEPPGGAAPEWPLDQLLAWLHGVLQYVVREEQSRVGFRREVSAVSISEPADAAPDPLDGMIRQETRAIVADCFATLDRDYREVLKLRMAGLKYSEIARRIGVNENTVATRVSRGIRELGRRIRKRMDRRYE
jgi:RNA polymerase sigma factor (sigma-70 family)